MKSLNWQSIPFALVAAASLFSTAHAQSQAASPASAATPAPAASTPPKSVVVIATIDAFWSADQYAKTSGYVAGVTHDIGDPVKKGEVLATLNVPELERNLLEANAGLAAKQHMKKAADAATAQAQQALAVAKSQLEGYQANLSLAQVTLKRQQELSEGKAATAQQLDEAQAKSSFAQATVSMGEAKISAAQADIQAAQANADVAAAQISVADAQVQEIQALLEYTKIVAPFDGVVTRRQISPGDLVQAATANRTTPLFTVQQLDTVRVFCEVPEAQSAGVVVGNDAEIKLFSLNGRVIKAKITRIANAIDPASRTMRAEIDLPNLDGILRPGMYAQVAITLQTAAVVDSAGAH